MKKHNLSRRDFFKTAGGAGIGVMWPPAAVSASNTDQKAAGQKTPKRPFGKSGVDVSILSLGGMFDNINNQLMLKQAIRLGVTYWDTADCYGGGNSEEGIGKFFKRYPQERQKIFLVTKSDDRNVEGMNRLLRRSLKRMNTDFIDLYLLHGLSSTRRLDDKVRVWVKKAKAAGKIRLFGFSTHRNMEKCMIEAAALGWIDGIMMTYNYRLMHEKKMKEAVAACSEAGIGLTAMKTQGGGQVGSGSEEEMQLAGRFLEWGFTAYQAKLKAVWENSHIASICSQMPNMTLLMANAAAAADKTTLTRRDLHLLTTYARSTRAGYCAGCSTVCQAAVKGNVPIADVMRYLMYSRSYGDRQRARASFGRLPQGTIRALAEADYAKAEMRCPHGMPIGRLMSEALIELA